ncbi:MAG: hypothetical protein E6I72_08530 [Chloroflexi bacterium]|nr:MAG: hypothetical protein E6I72_08530 [Chloroflexota bacterium]
MKADLYEQNTPAHLWRVLPGSTPPEDVWAASIAEAAHVLPAAARAHGDDMRALLAMTLGEGRFGARHWEPSAAQRVYYAIKPAVPRRLSRMLKRAYGERRAASLELHWPVERRYVRFQFEVVRNLLRHMNRSSLPFVNFWPDGRRYAFVLTHDVETGDGQRFVPAVADLEAALGFRSSFNFVPERYRLDRGLMDELRARGFEVGVHGLRHDGKLFFDRQEFMRQAERINGYIHEFGAAGFRAPLTQRHPEWMQVLDIEYDSSFFDTDPYEPITGGTMSVWPYRLGHFIELPYTLAQDHTLTVILGESTPRLWFTKLDFLREVHGMALLCTHPDYLQSRRTWRIYNEFLRAMSGRTDHYHALPREVARWWRARSEADGLQDLPGGTLGEIVGVDGDMPAIAGAMPAARPNMTA